MSLYLAVGDNVWEVERRHEMAQLQLRSRLHQRRLYLFFRGPGGEVRRSEIPDDFPPNPAPATLKSIWHYAEILQPPELGEMESQASLVIPSFTQTVKLMWRALRLRCPNCGGKGVLKSWFHFRESCPTCHLRFERGESQDYYLGGMMFNIVLAELLFAAGFVITLIVMWPNVPWEGLEYVLAAIAVIAPIVLYPVSRVIWLAFDLLFRPVTPAEMAWHSANRTTDDTVSPQK